MRTITVITTSSQQKIVFENVEATTLADVKRLLSTKGVNYDGMSFFEGISKAEYLADDSILPSQQNYRGQVTDDLVFMLTKSKKNIASGASDREAVYHVIHVKGLADPIKEAFGKNFTNISTDDLKKFIDDLSEHTTKESRIEIPEDPVEYVFSLVGFILDVLDRNDLLDDEDKEFLKTKGLNPDKSSKLSDLEIEEMFSFLNK